MSERSNAYEELGGSQPSELTLAEKLALYRLNLGSRAMRAEVEAVLKGQKDAEQHSINVAGAEEYRNAGIKIDLANGVNTNSQEYRLKQMKEERARTRRV